jgi:hypothetical protein
MKLLITLGRGYLGSKMAGGTIIRDDDLLVFDCLNRSVSRENLAGLHWSTYPRGFLKEISSFELSTCLRGCES